MKAQCQCGQLSLLLPKIKPEIVACHCVACQRRTGSPFGVMAYYPVDRVAIEGDTQSFARTTEEGNLFETFFCPRCGSTVYSLAHKRPDLIGVATGSIADPEFPPPGRSVWERSMHRWIEMPADIPRFAQGRH